MSSRTPLVVVGAATALLEISDLVAAINAEAPRYEIVGALDDDAALHGATVGGVEVWGPLSLARGLSDVRFVFAISSYRLRLRRIEVLEALGIPREMFETLIHPRADVSRSAVLGHGCAIFGNVFVGTQSRLGDFCIAYNSAFLSPYCELRDFAMVAGLAYIGPKARLGIGAFAGAASSVAPGVSVGTGGMVGLASAAFDDVAPGAVVLGNPAKPIKSMPVPPNLLEA